MNNPIFHTGLTEEKFWDLALKETLASIQDALKKFGGARIGLSGGRTPRHLYEALSNQNLPWDKITFIVLDERCVPVDDPESNLGMLKTVLLDQAQDAKIIYFDTTLPAPEAAENVARELIDLSNQRQPLFDLLILGAGKDGHIASLFEGDKALDSNEYATEAHAKGYPTEKRLSTGLMALQSAEHALLLLQGQEKAPVLQALKGEAGLKLTALRLLLSKISFTILTDFSI